MNVQSLEGSWKILKGKLRQRFAKWLADEAKYQEGKETELIGRILKGGPGKADSQPRVQEKIPPARPERTRRNEAKSNGLERGGACPGGPPYPRPRFLEREETTKRENATTASCESYSR